mmetsp:Transcript_33976/g.83502  ORF Transcript_33976/g.83502 Transcript_33976/m.83502 type:complete len:220 (+) Transcript_33976:2436-3095(+)
MPSRRTRRSLAGCAPSSASAERTRAAPPAATTTGPRLPRSTARPASPARRASSARASLAPARTTATMRMTSSSKPPWASGPRAPALGGLAVLRAGTTIVSPLRPWIRLTPPRWVRLASSTGASLAPHRTAGPTTRMTTSSRHLWASGHLALVQGGLVARLAVTMIVFPLHPSTVPRLGGRVHLASRGRAGRVLSWTAAPMTRKTMSSRRRWASGRLALV